MISIIIPVYNHAKALEKCLDSVLKQTYENYEVVIVDDGSTDEIEKVVDRYKKLFNLKLEYHFQENQGANAARNAGAKWARGEYLLFCDADIIMYPEMLKWMRGKLKNHPEASYVYSSFKHQGKKFNLWPFDAAKLKQMPYIHTTSLIRREHFPGFDIKIKRFQDWDLWLTMLEQGHVGVWLDDTLFKIIDKGTMSSWLPSFAYKYLPFLPAVRKYKAAMKIIKGKHHLV